LKFLLDVCVSSRSLESFLVGKGHDVVSAVSIDPRMSDPQLLELALREDRVLVTEDKDFGELVFVRRLLHGPIIRVVELAVEQQVQVLAELLEQYSTELTGRVIVTATRGRIRIRRIG
jgi:predicted nuclease of predicted toxin-antitoxin system